MADRTYTREEMEEIFRRAAEHTAFQQEGADAIRYEDLVAAAREVGIDAKSVEEVARKVEAERGAIAKKVDDDAVVAHELSERRHRARRSLLTYTIVTAFLVALDWMTPGGPWAQYVALIWGLFVALGFGRAMLAPSHGDRERILSREAKRRAKREREERRSRAAREMKERLQAQQEAIRRELADREKRGRELGAASREFERSVEEGVTALLNVLAKNIAEAVKSAGEESHPKGDFGTYVRRERQRQSGVSPEQAATPRVRVAAPEADARAPASSAETAEDAASEDRRSQRRAR